MDKKPKVSLIILNFNTWHLTVKELENIGQTIDYPNYEIIVVDNASTNESVKELEQYASISTIPFILIHNKSNNGYAAGNNVGIRKSIENGSDYSFILNNDILFTHKDTIKDIVSYMEDNMSVSVVSPRIVSLNGSHDKPIYYKRPSLWELTIGYPHFVKGRAKQDDTLVYDVYAPRGSCMMLRNEFLLSIGLLDESTFLYYEEPIIGEQIYNRKERVVNFGIHHVIHNHAETIKKNVPNMRILQYMTESQKIYLSKYRGFNRIQCLACEIMRKITYLLKH